MGQTPKKYHIADDGKIYRINDDGSFTEMGNVEDINTKPEEATPAPLDDSSYDDLYPDDEDTEQNRSGFRWIIIAVVLLIAAIITGVLIFINSGRSVVDYHDSESVHMPYKETVMSPIDTPQYTTEANAEAAEAPAEAKAASETPTEYAEEPKTEKKSAVQTPAPDPDRVFEAVEQQAQFPGGRAALIRWLSNNIQYPEYAKLNNIEGRVTVRFTVERDGSISNPHVVGSVNEVLDREAIRVVYSMPRWLPGKNNGVAVRTYFNLPITFRLAR